MFEFRYMFHGAATIPPRVFLPDLNQWLGCISRLDCIPPERFTTPALTFSTPPEPIAKKRFVPWLESVRRDAILPSEPTRIWVKLCISAGFFLAWLGFLSGTSRLAFVPACLISITTNPGIEKCAAWDRRSVWRQLPKTSLVTFSQQSCLFYTFYHDLQRDIRNERMQTKLSGQSCEGTREFFCAILYSFICDFNTVCHL